VVLQPYFLTGFAERISGINTQIREYSEIKAELLEDVEE
jgi:hypothetical protein